MQFCDDCTSTKIDLPDDFPFGGYFHDTAYVRKQNYKQCLSQLHDCLVCR